jgi:hypothetical protein
MIVSLPSQAANFSFCLDPLGNRGKAKKPSADLQRKDGVVVERGP